MNSKAHTSHSITGVLKGALRGAFFLMGNELYTMENGLCGTLFGQIYWKFLLDLSQKGAIEFNSFHIKLIS